MTCPNAEDSNKAVEQAKNLSQHIYSHSPATFTFVSKQRAIFLQTDKLKFWKGR